MNIPRNFEAVFVVALGVAVAASTLMQAPEQAGATPQQARSASVATPSKMAVVVVTGQRMSALEKLRSLEQERRLARLGDAAGNKI